MRPMINDTTSNDYEKAHHAKELLREYFSTNIDSDFQDTFTGSGSYHARKPYEEGFQFIGYKLIDQLGDYLDQKERAKPTETSSQGFYSEEDDEGAVCLASDLDIRLSPPPQRRKKVKARVKSVRKMTPKIHFDEELM